MSRIVSVFMFCFGYLCTNKTSYITMGDQIVPAGAPRRRTWHSLPVELMEMILCTFTGNEEHFIHSLVCKQWRAIIHAYRERHGMPTQFQTPIAVGLRTPTLAIWSRDRGMPLSERSTAIAARHGRMETLQWLHNNDFPLNACVSAAAVW